MKVTWDSANILWNSNSFTWDEVQLVEEIVETIQQGGGVIEDDMSWMKPKKKETTYKRSNFGWWNLLIFIIYGKYNTNKKRNRISSTIRVS